MEVTGLRQFVHVIFQKLSVHPAGNGYPALFRAGEGEDDENRNSAPHQLRHWLANYLFFPDNG